MTFSSYMKIKYLLLPLLMQSGIAIAENTTANTKITPDPAGGTITAQQVGETTSYTMTAVPAQGYAFKQWSDGDINITRTITKSADQDDEFYAIFYRTDITNGSVSVTSVSADCTTAQVTAVPGKCATETSWSDAASSLSRSCTINDCDLTLTFLAPNVTDKAPENNYGILTSSAANCQITITATPKSGYVFYRWEDKNEQVLDASIAYNNPVVVDYAETDYYAEFVPDVSIVLDVQDKGSIDQATRHGFLLSAPQVTPNAGYDFLGWATTSEATTPDITYPYFCEGTLYAVYVEQKAVKGNDNLYYESVTAAIEAGNTTITILSNITDDVIINGQSITLVSDSKEIGDLTIENGGKATISGTLTVANLGLNTTTGASAQLVGASNLTVSGSTYLDIQLEPNASVASDKKWYSVSTPFAVDITTGIAPADGSEAKGFSIYSYDGALRNTSQKSGWVKMTSGNMVPGAFHMFTINGSCNVWRFTQSEGTIEKTTATPIYQYGYNESTNKIHGGWNGVGNTLAQYAKASLSGVLFGQVYDNELSKYDAKIFESTSFVIGHPFFIQAGAEGSLTFEADATGTAYTPSRTTNDDIVIYTLTLTNGQQSDALYLVANDNATDEYQVGHDLIKMMGGQENLYIWANAYSQMLCAQSSHPAEDGTTDYSITLYAPKAGEYQLTASEKDAPVYLVDGTNLQILGEEAMTLNLAKGMNKYTIRLGQRNISTSISSIEDGRGDASKVIKNNVLYILRNGQYYNAQGQLIK